MSDFYSILRKSILERGIVDSGERDAIYAQARRAMVRRLWSFEPALDEEEIERRIAAFDVAVSDIEADVMAAFSDADDAPVEPDDDSAERQAAPPYRDDDRAAGYRERDAYERDPYRSDPYQADPYQDDPYRADPYQADPYRAAPYRTDPDETDRAIADDRRAAYREPAVRPVANPRRLPALIDPVAFGRQVREAGLVRYYEEARYIREDTRYVQRQPQDPYDDTGREAPYREPEVDEPPPPPPRRGRQLARRRAPEPPVDPYEDVPGYREEPPAPQPPQRQYDRWSQDGPPRMRPQRPSAPPTSAQRRLGLDDDLPRRRQRRRQRPRQPLSERDKIFMLLGVIGVCVLMLGGIGVYVLVPRDGGVTVDIDSRHEVSDAATAVRLAAQAMAVSQTFMLFDGRDPTVFETSPDNPVRFDASAGAVRISSSTGSPGVKALIGPGLATRLAGHDVRVTIVARSAKNSGAATMRFAYQSGVAISHWQTANLGSDYQAVALTWRVPSLQTDRAGDVLLIQPGVPGTGTGADVKSIKIDLLSG